MGRMDPSHRYAQYFLDATNNLNVDVDEMATLVMMSGRRVKVLAFKFALRVIRNLAIEYDYGDFSESENPDHASAVIKARKLQDVVDRFP